MCAPRKNTRTHTREKELHTRPTYTLLNSFALLSEKDDNAGINADGNTERNGDEDELDEKHTDDVGVQDRDTRAGKHTKTHAGPHIEEKKRHTHPTHPGGEREGGCERQKDWGGATHRHTHSSGERVCETRRVGGCA